ncbi:hypothetical protein ACIB24_22990 [Spongisporangium articulatum]|uniref:DUF4304 domain-containing protein n=1 Tax=Spongisporangium articulatum TaxID=3362603 RepID=A0ABW8AU90_9ACTN
MRPGLSSLTRDYIAPALIQYGYQLQGDGLVKQFPTGDQVLVCLNGRNQGHFTEFVITGAVAPPAMVRFWQLWLDGSIGSLTQHHMAGIYGPDAPSAWAQANQSPRRWAVGLTDAAEFASAGEDLATVIARELVPVLDRLADRRELLRAFEDREVYGTGFRPFQSYIQRPLAMLDWRPIVEIEDVLNSVGERIVAEVRGAFLAYAEAIIQARRTSGEEGELKPGVPEWLPTAPCW